jgi:hypothetical protein
VSRRPEPTSGGIEAVFSGSNAGYGVAASGAMRCHYARFAVIFTSMTQTLSVSSVLDGYAIDIAEF